MNSDEARQFVLRELGAQRVCSLQTLLHRYAKTNEKLGTPAETELSKMILCGILLEMVQEKSVVYEPDLGALRLP